MVSGLTPPSRRRDEDRIKSEVEEIQEVLRHGSSSTGISAISGGNMSGDTSPYTAPDGCIFSQSCATYTIISNNVYRT